MTEKSKPHDIYRVLVVPPSDRRGRKCPPLATKQSKLVPPADQVMTQVKLPPYRGPRNPLDLVFIEVIFGRIFEAFQQISQAAAVDGASSYVNKPLKRFYWPPLKKMLVPRYSYILFFIV
jgi:hypothetical protein